MEENPTSGTQNGKQNYDRAKVVNVKNWSEKGSKEVPAEGESELEFTSGQASASDSGNLMIVESPNRNVSREEFGEPLVSSTQNATQNTSETTQSGESGEKLTPSQQLAADKKLIETLKRINGENPGEPVKSTKGEKKTKNTKSKKEK